MVANIIIDVAIVIILLIGAIWGWKSGFINTVAKPVKFILTIIISLSLCSWFGSVAVQPIISEPVINKLTEFLMEKCGEITASNAMEELPTLIKMAAALAGVSIGDLATEAGQAELVNLIIDAVTEPFLNIVSVIIAYIILHILFTLILTIIFAIINAMVEGGFVGFVNRFLGAIILTVLAAAIVWGICGISDLILNLPVLQEQAWVQEFTGGVIYNFFKSLNPIDLLLSF